MLVDLPQSSARETRDFLAAHMDGLLAEMGHTDSLQFRRLLRARFDRLEEALRAIDGALERRASELSESLQHPPLAD
jgi:hypothetical protein